MAYKILVVNDSSFPELGQSNTLTSRSRKKLVEIFHKNFVSNDIIFYAVSQFSQYARVIFRFFTSFWYP